MSGSHYQRQSWLDFGHAIPQGAPDAVLERRLRTWRNADGITEGSSAKSMSELRLMGCRSTRENWAALVAHAEKTYVREHKRFQTAFFAAARRLRKSGRL
jgi:hypothetical protein